MSFPLFQRDRKDGWFGKCCVGGVGIDVKGKGMPLGLEFSYFTTLSITITFILIIAAGEIRCEETILEPI